MVFEYRPTGDAGILAAFGEVTGSEVMNGRLTLAKTVGEGSIRGFSLSPSLKMMIHQYVLNEELVFRRIAAKHERDTITITFHNVFHADRTGIHAQPSVRTGNRLPAVQVTSADMDFETIFPAKTTINTILIAVQVELLNELVHPDGQDSLLQTIISGTQPYLYEEISSPEIQDVAAKLVTANVPRPLHDFYYKLKAEELIYLFLLELLRRPPASSQPLRSADVKRMYAIRDNIISDLSVLPNLPELARFSGLSASKMTRLFRQIFGSSIYTYYQTLRMNEAAYLIKEQQLSVSEAGYRLGFTNLSHFGRLFEKHTGQKPKKYASTAKRPLSTGSGR